MPIVREPCSSSSGKWTWLPRRSVALNSKQPAHKASADRRALTHRRRAGVGTSCRDPSLIVSAEVRLFYFLSGNFCMSVCCAMRSALFCCYSHCTNS